jgi:hypothetical protein
MATGELYRAGNMKERRRAKWDEIEERAGFLIGYADRHGGVTVRQLYYRAEIEGVPRIDKTEDGSSAKSWIAALDTQA